MKSHDGEEEEELGSGDETIVGRDIDESLAMGEEEGDVDDNGDYDDDNDEVDWQLMPRALPVGQDFAREPPRDAPPTSGEEYLRLVRWEAKKCPNVVVATEDMIQRHQTRETNRKQTSRSATNGEEQRTFQQPKKKQKSKGYGGMDVGGLADFVIPAPLPRCPPALKPSSEWESEFLDTFRQFRQQLEQQQREKSEQKGNKAKDRLPRLKDVQRWKAFCFGDSSNLTPETIASIDDVRVSALLDYFSLWMKEEREQQQTKDEEVVNTTENETTKQVHNNYEILNNAEAPGARWLYVLLAKLETPIPAESASTLRNILRHCSEVRAGLSSREDGRLPFLNILITVLSRFFGQGGGGDDDD